MALNPKPPVIDPHPFAPQPPRPITGEDLREQFAARYADPKLRGLLLSFPEKVLASKNASWRDKLDAWAKIVNRLGLDEKQRMELSGSLNLATLTTTELAERAARLLGVSVKP